MNNPSRSRFAGMLAVLLASSLAAPVLAQAAAPAFAGIFGDHAVLQRGEPVTVWGTAEPGQGVTVNLAGTTAAANADANGRWRVSMPAMTAGGPHTLSVTGNGGGVTRKDIMIGDVYLCGGQSNMAFPARLAPGGPEAAGVRRAGDDLVLKFKHVGGGLRTYSAGHAIGFEACAAQACRYVLAVAQGDTVTLKGANQPGTTQVRYAWADAPYVNLYSTEDLPAAPFAMDVE